MKGFKSSGFKSSFKAAAPAPLAVIPTEEDVDGEEMPEDVDGEEMVDIDGEAMDDVDGEPIPVNEARADDDDVDGLPMEMDDDLDGEPM